MKLRLHASTLVAAALFAAVAISSSDAFQAPAHLHARQSRATASALMHRATAPSRTILRLASDDNTEDTETTAVLRLLEKKFPSMLQIIPEATRKTLNQPGPLTIFAPNEDAFEKLGDKKRSQLQDPRNLEIVEKMAGYHIVVGSAVTAMELKTEDWTRGRPKDGTLPNTVVAGVVTMSGEVPVGRAKTGGFLGFAAKETGDIVVGPGASILQSYVVNDCIVHEMDAFVSPDILWRYCDQLQIKNPLGSM